MNKVIATYKLNVIGKYVELDLVKKSNNKWDIYEFNEDESSTTEFESYTTAYNALVEKITNLR